MVRILRGFLFLALVVGINFTCFSQQSKDTLESKKRNLQGFPIVYYAPETSLGFGAFGVYAFKFKKDSISSRASSVNVGAAYTLRNQVLFYAPFTILSNNDTNRFLGEIGYYKYMYFYFGIGNEKGSFEDKKEQYNVSFPRARLSYLRRMNKNLFIGVRGAYDNYFQISYSDSSRIVKEKPTGYNAGVNLGVGPAFLIDSRDELYYPRKGWLLDCNSTVDLGKVVSNYTFTRINLEISNFQKIFEKSVLGMNLNYQYGSSQTPFYHLPLLGGGKRLRGQFEGEFRDKNTWQTQIEFRQEFFKNWGAVAFIGVGWVAPNWNSWRMDQVKEGYGLGLRYKLNKKEHINLRLDVGFSHNKILPYFTIGEAF
ncbi:MAG: BamA/TamA family outer membrane protein [Bacteroidetes bacterium]|nr:BamA/TamA family outer membrane protein [Bacteroidota bacterium]